MEDHENTENSIPYITFGAPLIGEEEINEVVETLKSGWIGTGPRVARFEENFAKYKGVTRESVTAVGSCTAGLQLCLKAAELQPGDEVIIPALTFCATVNAVIHAGATPVLADVDAKTWNVTADTIREALTERTRAIVVVHMAGRPCDMDAITQLVDDHNLILIEDCAHALETRYKGKEAGTFGDFAAFSFYVTKNLTTGEGGMVLAKDEDHVARIKKLALHGMSKDAWNRYSDEGYQHYLVEECGFKNNMTDIQAAIGIHQLARLEEVYQRRIAIWNQYVEAFSGKFVIPHKLADESRHALHLFQILVPEKDSVSRDESMRLLHQKGIGTGVHYLAIPEHPYYQETFGWTPEDYPVAKELGRRLISLPLSAGLSETDIRRVIRGVLETFGK